MARKAANEPGRQPVRGTAVPADAAAVLAGMGQGIALEDAPGSAARRWRARVPRPPRCPHAHRVTPPGPRRARSRRRDRGSWRRSRRENLATAPEGSGPGGAGRHARHIAPALHGPAGAPGGCCRQAMPTQAASATASGAIRPARVSQPRSRHPLRWTLRSGEMPPFAAPVFSSTSFSLPSIPRINCFTAEFHDAFGGIGRHLAQEIVIGALVSQFEHRRSLLGHRHLRAGSRLRNPNLTRRKAMTATAPPAACWPPENPDGARSSSMTMSRHLLSAPSCVPALAGCGVPVAKRRCRSAMSQRGALRAVRHVSLSVARPRRSQRACARGRITEAAIGGTA